MKTSNLVSNYKKATIEMLLLKLLSEGDMYGYQLCQELKKRSKQNYAILEGSMYPILYRLTDEHHISCYEKKVGARQIRIYYHLEDSGHSYYKELLYSYHEFSELIQFLLCSTKGEIYEKNI